MLNDAQRTRLCILMSLIEEKMRAIEARLDCPEERGLMFEVTYDIVPKTAQTLREKIGDVYGLIRTLRDSFGLPREVKPASREIFKGLPQLWVAVQESDSKRLQGYGGVDHTLPPFLDPKLEALAHLLLELEDIATGKIVSMPHAVANQGNHAHQDVRDDVLFSDPETRLL